MILVGQAPSRTSDPSRPLLDGHVGRRLRELAGLTEAQLEAVERTNLIGSWPGKQGKGDRFPVREARAAASALAPRLAGRDVLVVGQATARAMGLDPEPLAWRRGPGYRYAVLPHPSGVNCWWNDPDNRLAAARFARGAVRRARCQRAPKR